MGVGTLGSAPEETFSASRWTRGNLWFPTRIVVSPLRVGRVKKRLFGSSEESISISQVAWLLGYREVSAFTHAFKRWTGTTPREARAAQSAATGGRQNMP